jgi:hypothetical protein
VTRVVWAIAIAIAIAGLVACGGKKKPTPPQVVPVPIATVAPSAALDARELEDQAPPRMSAAKPRLQITLRSSPAGASASVDGRLIGTTPVRWVVEDDGKDHLFEFVLSGFAPWKLRFSPSRDGVIHATMEPTLVAPDAG